MDIVALEGPEALAELQPEWDALLARCAHPSPFLTHAWLTASWRHYGGRDRLLTVCVRDGGRLVGAVGLRAKRSFGPERLLFAGTHMDYGDLLIEAGAEWDVLQAFVGWLAEEHQGWGLVRLRSVSCQAPTDELLPVLAREAGLATCSVRAQAAPVILVPATLDEFVQTAPGRARVGRHVSKRRKLIRQHGELSLERLTGPDLTPEAFDRFLELHRRGWEGRGGSAVIPDARAGSFHAEVAAALAPSTMARLWWLRAGDCCIAGEYGFVVGTTFMHYIPAYDPDFARWSPGGQMVLSMIERAIEQGWRWMDLMVGAEAYKFDYTRRCAYTMDHTLARTPLKLRLFAASTALRSALER
ncbi:MAG: GNAT family N-acetyltransferase [Armatimonadetes bacterium]|nr:GNAT family N-acetyltransferase [Armatimonadota bacterium]